MSIPISLKNVKKRLDKLHLKLLEKYKGVNHKHKLKCFCGNVFFTVLNRVFVGDCKSCGCSRKQFQPNHSNSKSNLWQGYGEISQSFWGKIKRRALKRTFKEKKTSKFDVNIKFAWNLFISQNKKCALSGVNLIFAKNARTTKECTASLDRIDSSKGYTKDNIQWVHKKVNYMKGSQADDSFIKWCKIIAKYNS